MSASVFHYQPQAARIADFQRRLATARRLPAADDPDSQLGIAPAHLARLASVMTNFDWKAFAGV